MVIPFFATAPGFVTVEEAYFFQDLKLVLIIFSGLNLSCSVSLLGYSFWLIGMLKFPYTKLFSK
jgi:hypothetical protein